MVTRSIGGCFHREVGEIEAGHHDATHEGRFGIERTGFDAQDYKRCNVIERGFNLTKQWRGLATRYDKLAVRYTATLHIGVINDWLKRLT